MSTIRAADVAVGDYVDRLTYDEHNRPRYIASTVKEIRHSTVIVGGFIIVWADGRESSHGPNDRFIPITIARKDAPS